MKEENKKIDIVMITIMILVLLIGITYAYFKIVKEIDSNSTIYDLDINFQDGELINSNELWPIEEDKIEEEGIHKTFQISKKKEYL